VTGFNYLSAELAAKRLELLLELMPGAKNLAVLVDPAYPEKVVEVFWQHGSVGDPYGVYGWEDDCIGRNYFARSPGTNVWVEFGDLPDAVRDRLWARIKAGDFYQDDTNWLIWTSR
jgi:hypothetical protein